MPEEGVSRQRQDAHVVRVLPGDVHPAQDRHLHRLDGADVVDHAVVHVHLAEVAKVVTANQPENCCNQEIDASRFIDYFFYWRVLVPLSGVVHGLQAELPAWKEVLVRPSSAVESVEDT